MYRKFPNQWSAHAKLWTPDGTLVEVKGPLASEIGILALTLFSKPKPTPADRKKLTAFLKSFSPSMAKADAEDNKRRAARKAPKKAPKRG